MSPLATWQTKALGLLAALILSIVLTPGEVWRHPVVDASYRGFDPLVAASQYPDGSIPSSVVIAPQAVQLKALNSQSVFNLVTTPLKKFRASFDVAVHQAGSAKDSSLVVGVWSPTALAGDFVALQGGSGVVQTLTVEGGSKDNLLSGGYLTRQHFLGLSRPDTTYQVVIDIDKSKGIGISVFGAGLRGFDLVTPSEARGLFDSVRVSLAARAASSSGAIIGVLSNYELDLPHQRFWADKANDPLERILVATLLAVSAITLMLGAIALKLFTSIPAGVAYGIRLVKMIPRRPKLAAILAGAAALYFLINGLLFSFGGHPFDMSNEKLYAYVARAYGPSQLYYLPNTVSLRWVWGGVPYSEAAFPYEPVMAYLSTAIGWLFSWIFAAGHLFSPESTVLEYFIKSANVLFGLADAALVWLILRQLGLSHQVSSVGGALFLFNPAVWFSMSVWGQTHVVSVLFILLAIWFIGKDQPLAAWLALAAAALTRPQMIVPVVLLSLVLLRRYGWQRNAPALSWTVVIVFVLLLPLTLATSPSLPIDIMVNNFRIQEVGGNDAVLTTVSQDAYSIWPLVTYLQHGTSGILRSFTPSSRALYGALTYQRAGLWATGFSLAAISGRLLLGRDSRRSEGDYIPLVALGMVAFLMLMTGVVSTHFLLALPLIILCRKWMSSIAYYFAVTTWTVTTLVPMYGDMGNVIRYLNYPLLSPEHNAVTRFVVALYSWDRFITVAIVANVCVLAWLGVVALRWHRHPSVREAV